MPQLSMTPLAINSDHTLATTMGDYTWGLVCFVSWIVAIPIIQFNNHEQPQRTWRKSLSRILLYMVISVTIGGVHHQFYWEYQPEFSAHLISWFLATFFCHLSYFQSISFGINLLHNRDNFASKKATTTYVPGKEFNRGQLIKFVNWLYWMDTTVMILSFPHTYGTAEELSGMITLVLGFVSQSIVAWALNQVGHLLEDTTSLGIPLRSASFWSGAINALAYLVLLGGTVAGYSEKSNALFHVLGTAGTLGFIRSAHTLHHAELQQLSTKLKRE